MCGDIYLVTSKQNILIWLMQSLDMLTIQADIPTGSKKRATVVNSLHTYVFLHRCITLFVVGLKGCGSKRVHIFHKIKAMYPSSTTICF